MPLPEACIGLLIEDLNNRNFSVTHHGTQSFSQVTTAMRAEEFKNTEHPIVAVSFEQSKPGKVRGLSDLRGKDGDIFKFSQEKITPCVIRISTKETRDGNVSINPRLISESILNLVLRRVRRSWPDILINYGAFLSKYPEWDDKDLTPLVQGRHRSLRMLKFDIKHEEIWQVVDDDTEPAPKIIRVDFHMMEDVTESTGEETIVRSESNG